ncbi:platelet-activating factor receptor [Lepisosteus oculatus]
MTTKAALHLRTSGEAHFRLKTVMKNNSEWLASDTFEMSPGLTPCEVYDPVTYVLVPVVYALVFVLGLLGNITALVVFCRNGKRLKKAVRIFLINLTAADVMFNITLPFWVSYYSRGGDWRFGDISCRLAGSLYYVSTYCTISFMTFISVNRYCILRKSQPKRPILRKRGASLVCILTWAFWLGCAVPSLVTKQSSSAQAGKTKCFEAFSESTAYSLAACIFFTGCFIVVATSCLSIIRSLRDRQTTHGAHRQTAKAMILAMLLVFVVCVAPFHITLSIWSLNRTPGNLCEFPSTLNILHRLHTALLSINSCIDPFIYCFSVRNFRQELRQLWQGLGRALLPSSSASQDIASSCKPPKARQRYVLPSRSATSSSSCS